MNRSSTAQQSKVENSALPAGGILQRKCACGSKTVAGGECAECGKKKINLQRKLTIGASHDPLEREADHVAEQVMAVPINSGIDAAPPRIQHFPRQSGYGLATAPASVDRVLASSGRPLEPAVRQDMESRFGYEFSQVRVHTGSAAEQSAREVNAHAYTAGNNIVFGTGQYSLNTFVGRKLLVHELTHVVQQKQAPGQLTNNILQRDEEEQAMTPEIVGQEPGLILCFALCEIGVPPGAWRTFTSIFLRAVSEEYSTRYGQIRGSARYQAFWAAFRAYSTLNQVKAILTFVVQGKIAGIAINSSIARSLQQNILQLLIRGGATEAGIVAAEQIVRKIAFVIEIAIAAGCAGYCSVRSYTVLVRELASSIVDGIATLESIGSGVRNIIGGLATEFLVRPIFYAEALMEVTNWRLSYMPVAARLDTIALGLYFSNVIEGETIDELLEAHARSISSYSTATELVRVIIAEINRDRLITGEEALNVEAIVNDLPLNFFNLLYEEGYLNFEQDPNLIANRLISELQEREE